MNHKTLIDGDDVPVGYALEGKALSQLDDHGREVERGQTGEIVVRSAYLSPGYWRSPHLTEDKFKPAPSDPAKRYYYKGDLAAMAADGCLVHRGRKDVRVKIRGYGVDTLEVENTLLAHPKIRQAVVVGRRNQRGTNCWPPTLYHTRPVSCPRAYCATI